MHMDSAKNQNNWTARKLAQKSLHLAMQTMAWPTCAPRTGHLTGLVLSVGQLGQLTCTAQASSAGRLDADLVAGSLGVCDWGC